MLVIKKTKVRSIGNHLPDGLLGQEFYASVPLSLVSTEILAKIGFRDTTIGQQIVPAPQFKRVAFFNAEGGFTKRKDLPMETVYREQEWTWKDWADNEHSKTVFIPYQRYRRESIPAPGETISIVESATGELLLVSDTIIYDSSNETRIKLIINLFLEIFGFCEIRNVRLDAIVTAPVIRLNWDILPKGTTCWPSLQENLNPIVNRAVRPSIRSIVMSRLEGLNDLKPDFVAVGRGGFHGYVIFGFESMNRYVLESIYSGNAIYVFNNNWEELAQLTKAEIINGNLQVARIVHREGYWKQVLSQVA